MNDIDPDLERHQGDAAPGMMDIQPHQLRGAVEGYVLGLVLAGLLTAASFYFAHTRLLWTPSIPAALMTLAVAQIGVHLVYFLHITTSPDHVNNVIALAFGVFIVVLVVGGSVWIMNHMNYNMMSMDQIMNMQR